MISSWQASCLSSYGLPSWLTHCFILKRWPWALGKYRAFYEAMEECASCFWLLQILALQLPNFRLTRAVLCRLRFQRRDSTQSVSLWVSCAQSCCPARSLDCSHWHLLALIFLWGVYMVLRSARCWCQRALTWKQRFLVRVWVAKGWSYACDLLLLITSCSSAGLVASLPYFSW